MRLPHRDAETAAAPDAISALARSPSGRWLTDRDPAEDDDVWLVTCFFTRVGYRRHGFAHRLLEAATELAARAVEGFPRTSRQVAADDYYLGDAHLRR